MLKVVDIVRYYFPRASKKKVEFILYGKTGWPSFWKGDPLLCLAGQLNTYKRSQELGRDVCFCCGKIRFKSQLDSMGMCAKGEAALAKARNQ